MASKIILDCDNELWDKVKIFKIENKLSDMNDAVLELVKRGLKK